MVERTRTRHQSGKIVLEKRLGQHHLVQPEACAPLVDFLRPRGLLVVEIGPGGGVLTEQLLAAEARVVAIELDLAWGLSLVRTAKKPSAMIVLGDALDIDWRRFPDETLVAGNLPFNISTVLIKRLLCHWQRIPRAAFLVQKEVGDRLLAEPGSKSYGALSVLVAARAKIFKLGLVKRGSFQPPPKVDGVFVGLELRRPPLEESEMEGFAKTVRLSFAQRRKQIRNGLAASWGRHEAERALAEAKIRPTARAEDLSLEEFVRLHEVHSGWFAG